jgi:hypothetical protein
MTTFPSRCTACKRPLKSPLLIGGMEVDLCESCQPRPTSSKKADGPYDDYTYED